jgi:hypothetical protein
MHDILIISLQFLYAFGGLILFGSLIFNIVKNQALINEKRLRFEKDFDAELVSQLAEQRSLKALKVNHTGTGRGNNTLRRETRRTNYDASGDVSDPGATGRDISLKSRQIPMRKRIAGQAMASRYERAAGLAARGFNAKDIRHRVGLPQCEIELIASLNDTCEKSGWEAHQSILDVIESGT